MAAVIVGLDSVIAWGNYPFQIDRLDWHTNGRTLGGDELTAELH